MARLQNTYLQVPQPRMRPGDPVDFSDMNLPDVGSVPKPYPDTDEMHLRNLPYTMIRVLSDGNTYGEWVPSLNPDTLNKIYKAMIFNRVFDDRMFLAQRQGKTSFYMKSRGEEALSVIPSLLLRDNDMCFPTYRMVGWLLARDYPIDRLINQIFSNKLDPLKGKQLPILYSARDYGFYSLSGNVGSRFGHAVGWAMASAYRGQDKIAIGYIGEGTTAEGDFHEALTFASVYKAPVILCVSNNQWAISSFSGIAGANETTFAAKALAYGLPGLRVDGNDVFAVWAALEWAESRARSGHGATLIEFFTYRAEGHSTSDDPSKYRPKEEAQKWPLGDPISRLKHYLIANKLWDENQEEKLISQLTTDIKSAIKIGENVGVLGQSKPPLSAMFEGVFKEPDWRIKEQMKEIGL